MTQWKLALWCEDWSHNWQHILGLEPSLFRVYNDHINGQYRSVICINVLQIYDTGLETSA